MLPIIALTAGDPAGVGPEICLTAAADASVLAHCIPVIFGTASVLQRCGELLQRPVPQRIIPWSEWPLVCQSLTEPAIVDFPVIDARELQPGVMNAATGRASYEYIQRAIDAALAQQVAAVTTGPINKMALHAAGINFPGHTEMFAARTNAAHSCMMQYAPEIVCSFVTTHVGYADVPALLTIERITEVIDLTAAAIRRLKHKEPVLVVCGLNPHAGEGGLFGNREEERFILPAIEHARQQGLNIEGPLPPDTAFLPWKRAATDAFICMYHDQGHIPVKALAFDSAVNTTLGLSIIRTSVDHGTAADIAWQGIARPNSLFSALRVASRLASEPT
jgi:4-phospho-D-threonate 3-dehydrogenase / 4-phospho-D-erythronate 3-dehydrogenase